MALFLTEDDVKKVLSMDLALETVEQAFRLMADGKATNTPRSRLRLPNGAFNFMTAAAPGAGAMGLKAYAVTRGNPAHFYVHLSDTETGELLTIMEASELGRVRTGAASGVATKYMSRTDSSRVGVIGGGNQARSQLEAMCKVRDIRSVKVYTRTPERREGFASSMSESLGIEVTPSETAEACVRDVDVIITMTNSERPVLEGDWLQPGVHVNAAGANHWMRRELDDEAVGQADVIVADDIENAKLECGDLIYPIERGLLRWEQVANLSEVIGGRASGRNDDHDITLFESQGLAVEDVTTGMRVYQLAKEKGLGQELPF